MKSMAWSKPRGWLALRVGITLLGLAGFMAACGGSQNVGSGPSSSPTALPLSGDPSLTPVATSIPLELLAVEPEKGHVGSPFTIAGEGLPPNKEVEFVWVTVDGNYVTEVSAENVQFIEKKYTEKRVSIGRALTDDQGRVTLSLNVPDDYGEVHDIYALLDGREVAKGGFRIMRNMTITPQEGPLGTPITIKVTGLGWKPFESTVAVRYDNLPTGIITAVTTRGTATAQIRAAGSVGKHVIDINHGARSVPYLNNQQSGTAHIPDFRFWFTVTEATDFPSFYLDWPDDSRVSTASDAIPRTTTGNSSVAPGLSAALETASGPILSQATLRASGLSPNHEVELFWVSARGNRVSPSGWSLTETPILNMTADESGSLKAEFQIPDDLGGWHVVKMVQGDKVLAEVPYFVERSLVDVTPRPVKSGEVFTVHIKGVGWTELDNGVAVTYDNAYIGFACGFNSNGDVTINLVATGGPGIHLIDLYPMIYQGHGKPPWGYQQAILSFQQDAPGLALGYKLPAFRLAVEVIP